MKTTLKAAIKANTSNLNPKLLKAHGRIVSVGGNTYRIMAHRLGTKVLAQAEVFSGKDIVDLVSGRSPLVRKIRTRIALGLIS